MTYDSTNKPQPVSDISKTAIWVAAARAVGARDPDSRARNPDYLAEKLLGDPSKLELNHPVVSALSLGYEDAMQSFDVANLVPAMTVRTRFIDEALERAIAAGATQVLILGAGLDSHAYRWRDLLASVHVFEIDRLETLAFKQQRVAEVLGGPPENLTYVPIDFQHEELTGALQQHGYDTSRQTFVIMEGVTMYLSEDALRSTFRFIASHAPGSSIVFDMATRAMVAGLEQIDLSRLPPAARTSMQYFMDMIRNEPWLFGFPVDGERAFINELGLELRELLTIGSEEAAERYLTRADGTIVGAEAQAKSEALREATYIQAAGKMSVEELEKLREKMQEQKRQMAYRIAEAVVARQ